MKDRLHTLYKSADDYTILEEFPGTELKGKEYQPLYQYFVHLKKERPIFQVLNATFVTTDAGTGIVHQAPYFGEVFFYCHW